MSQKEASSLTSIIFALGANGAIALAKLFAALQTGSNSMMAEAIHSFADCGNQGLLLLGLKRAKGLPTPDHPLGYGKAIYFWSFLVAVILFSMGGLFSIYEGIHKLDSHEGLTTPWLAIGILVFSIVMESISLWGCLREINKARGRRRLWRWFRETRESALLVVLGEDIAALAGLVFALVAISLSVITGDPVYDAAGSIAIGVLLVLVAFAVGAEVHDLLIGQSVEPEAREAIRAHLEARPEVARLFSIITLQLGDDVMLSVKAEMREKESAPALIADINRCEASLRDTFPKVRWIFFEPDESD
jgi:cation diffusion facilitator family transporter